MSHPNTPTLTDVERIQVATFSLGQDVLPEIRANVRLLTGVPGVRSHVHELSVLCARLDTLAKCLGHVADTIDGAKAQVAS